MNPEEAFQYLFDELRNENDGSFNQYVIPEDLAKPLYNYQSMRHDLILVKDAAEKLKQPNLDETIMAALWHTIIVLYGKCFTSSDYSAKLESKDCFKVGDDTFLRIHGELMHLRHTFVAHRAETIHEFALAFIRIHTNRRQTEVMIRQLKRNRPSVEDLQKYIELSDHLITIVKEKFIKAGTKIAKRLFETTTPRDLLKI